MLDLVVDRLVEVLTFDPGGVLPPASIGARRPSSSAELPSLALGVTVEDTRGTGLGRYIATRGSAVDPQPVHGDMFTGVLTIEIWGASAGQVSDVFRRLHQRLMNERAALRTHGFMRIEPASLEPSENLLQPTPTGSPFSVWKQSLSYRYAFATASVIPPSEGIIRRIDFELPQQDGETFSLPAPPKP